MMRAEFHHDLGSKIYTVYAYADTRNFAGNLYIAQTDEGELYCWFPNTDAANNPLDAEFLQDIVNKLNSLNGA